MTRPPRPPRVPVLRATALARRALWALADRVAPPAPPPVTLRRPAPGQAFRIVFVVCESGKWTHQALFDTLADTPGLALRFALAPSDVAQRLSAPARAAHLAGQQDAFGQWGPVEPLLLAGDRMRDLRALEADLAFLQQPWGLRGVPRRLAGHIPCAHVSYELGVVEDPVQQYGLPDFHPWLWRLFLASPLHVQMLARTRHAPAPERVVVSGSPRLDAWQHQIGAGAAQAQAPLQVVWAPHHSLARNSLRLGTFAWSGPAMLALARETPQIRFVLRPHPNFWHMLERWQTGAAAQFRADWAALPNTAFSENGDALPLLAQSGALITDSASFLAEFMMTGRPILRLTRPDSVALSDFGAMLAPGFYPCATAGELQQAFASVILSGQDPLQKTRAALAEQLASAADNQSAARIRDEILSALSA